jgi:hypothetical protein
MSERLICGIDPDKKGAIVFVKKDLITGEVKDVDIYTMPLMYKEEKPKTRTSKAKKTTHIDFEVVKAILRTRKIETIVIERQHIFSSKKRIKNGEEVQQVQGNRSNETTMKHYGQFIGLFTGMDLPFVEVHPNTWQKIYDKNVEIPEDIQAFKMEANKKRSIVWVKQLIPTINLIPSTKHKVAHHAIADAVLMVNYYYSLSK